MGKTLDNDDEKVRDHCHVIGGAAHSSCNINLQLAKKVPVMFQNFRGYDSHLIFCELKNFNVEIDAIPDRLKKYMAILLNENLIFSESSYAIYEF